MELKPMDHSSHKVNVVILTDMDAETVTKNLDSYMAGALAHTQNGLNPEYEPDKYTVGGVIVVQSGASSYLDLSFYLEETEKTGVWSLAVALDGYPVNYGALITQAAIALVNNLAQREKVICEKSAECVIKGLLNWQESITLGKQTDRTKH